ncbi:hypothetical protein GCM10018952_45430 [Streptosporangium vulgare]
MLSLGDFGAVNFRKGAAEPRVTLPRVYPTRSPRGRVHVSTHRVIGAAEWWGGGGEGGGGCLCRWCHADR